MDNPVVHINELQAAAAFTKQSVVFDKLYADNAIVLYKRERVRAHIQQYIHPGQSVLELNSGTGEDAVWFAKNGYFVHATDISEGMQGMLKKKIQENKVDDRVTAELCSFTQLENLKQTGPYDYVFSNFAGLNCTDQLDKVLSSLPSLVNQGGVVTLVMLPGFCLWETLLVFKGKFKTAFRRFFSSKGVTAHVEGEYFKCWYYHPSYVIKKMPHDFTLSAIEGLCTIVPPSYIERFAEKHPRIYNWLKKKENKYKRAWPWRNIGDYYIISFRKK